MATKISRTNPFATSPTPAAAKLSTAKEKKDTSRVTAKQHLLDALDAKSDTQITDLKHTAEELVNEIEKNIFTQFGDDSKYKTKIFKIKTRLSNNKTIREVLKRGEIDVATFCTLDDSTFNDNSYFQSKAQKKSEGDTNNQQSMNKPGAVGKKSDNSNKKYHKPPAIIKPKITFDSNAFGDIPTTFDDVKKEKPVEKETKDEDNINKKTDLGQISSSSTNPIGFENNPGEDDPGIGIRYQNDTKVSQQGDNIKPMIQTNISTKKEDDSSNSSSKPNPLREEASSTKEIPIGSSVITDKDKNEASEEEQSTKEGLDLPYLLLLKKTLAEKKKNKQSDDNKKKKDKKEKGKGKKESQSKQAETMLMGKEIGSLFINDDPSQTQSINKENPFVEDYSLKPIGPVSEEHKEEERGGDVPQFPLKDTLKKEKVSESNTDSIIKADNSEKILFNEEPEQKEQEEMHNDPQSQEPKEKDQLESNDIFIKKKEGEVVKVISPIEDNKPTTSNSQKDISPFMDNNSNSRNYQNLTSRNENNNENGLSSSQLENSLLGYSAIKEKYRAINDAKLALETKVEIMKHEALSYQKEIASLKQALTQSRQPSTQSSEEMLKLDLIKSKQLLKSNEIEKDSLIKENNKLKNQLKTYEDNLASMIEDNKLFRSETEKRFSVYQKEIDQLRMQLSTRQSQSQTNPVPINPQKYNPTSMDILIKNSDSNSNNEENIHNEPFDNGNPEQNLLGVNDNRNMNGNIFHETKNEIYDTSSHRDISGEDNQFNFQHDDIVNHNDNKDNEDHELIIKTGDNKKEEDIYLNDDEKDNDNNIDINKDNNSNEVNINDVNDFNQRNDNDFEIVNAEDCDSIKSPKKEKEEEKKEEEVISPEKEIIPPKLVEDNQTEAKKKFQTNINALFDNSDDENDIFSSNPQKNTLTVTKKVNAPSKLPQKITTTAPTQTTTTVNTMKPKPPIVQPKAITTTTTAPITAPTTITTNTKTLILPPKKAEPKAKQEVTPQTVNNLFNDLENDVDDEIFNKQDGESIFGKSAGNSIFD